MASYPLVISLEERRRRLAAVGDWLNTHQQDALCVFDSTTISYLSGFFFQPTERPVVLVITADLRCGIVVPMLEHGHAQSTPLIEEIVSYPEYPGLRHPMQFLDDLLQHMHVQRSRIAADADGYSSFYGYRGPALRTLLDGNEATDATLFLQHLRSRKSAEELEILRHSMLWGDHAHHLLQARIRPGVSEIEIGQQVSHEATSDLFAALGSGYRNHTWGVSPIHTGFKAGSGTGVPHPLGTASGIAAGDLIITWSIAHIDGYHAELERTLFLGEASAQQAFYFQHMCQAQQVGIDAIKPGARCADIDKAVYAYWQANDLLPYVCHHTGHSLGMEIHEAPFLDQGDETVLEPGMVFSVEPGLYVPGLGGFRHSDTVVVTEHGHEVLTQYPRDLAQLTIPV